MKPTKFLSKDTIKNSRKSSFLEEKNRIYEKDIANYLCEQYKNIGLSLSFEGEKRFNAFCRNKSGEVFSFKINYDLTNNPIDPNDPNEIVLETSYLDNYYFNLNKTSGDNVSYILSTINEDDAFYKLDKVINELYNFDKNIKVKYYYLSFTHDNKLTNLSPMLDIYISGKSKSFLNNEDEVDLLFCHYLFFKNDLDMIVFNTEIPRQNQDNIDEINTFLKKYRNKKIEYLDLLRMLKV